jgi:hypothetical protein
LVEVTPTPKPSIWDHKPWWCQPWSIVLTGLVAVSASWMVLHRWWVSVPVLLAVLLWWTVFLILVPAAYSNQQTESSDWRGRGSVDE